MSRVLVSALVASLALGACGGVAKVAGKGARSAGRSSAVGRGCARAARPGAAAVRRAGGEPGRALWLVDDAGALGLATARADDWVLRSDGLAALGDDAFTDLYVQRGALARLPELTLPQRVRLWLVDPDGARRLVRLGADGVAEVALTRDGEPRLWIRLAGDLSDLAVEVAGQPARVHDLVVVDPDCEQVQGARVAPEVVTALTATHRVVLLLTDAALDPRLPELARIASDDLIAFGPLDVCAPDGAVLPAAEAILARARFASTWGDVWSVGASGRPALVVSDVTRSGDWLSLGADSLVASVNVDEPGVLPPAWVWALAGGLGALVGAGWLLMRRR